MILKKTVNLVKQIYKIHRIIPPKITKVIIGLGYTCVEVSAYAYEPFLGLASTLPSVISETECSKINFAGELTNHSISELLNWSYEAPSLKKIIGVATLNGVSQHILKILNPYRIFEGDILNHLKINENTKVSFIGLIKPLIKTVGKITDLITIVEDTISISPEFKKFRIHQDIQELGDDDLLIDILFCTGTALLNNTLELILDMFKNRAQNIILIGPTASMIPDIMFDYGIDIVCGMEIFDSKSTIKVVQEGGGTKLFKKYGKKYNLIKD